MPELTRKLESVIRALHTGHGRKKNPGLCVCEGINACSEFVACRKAEIIRAFCREDFDRKGFELDFTVLDEDKFNSLAFSQSPQGIFILARKPALKTFSAKPQAPFILLLDRIADPGNMGTILRTLRAAGIFQAAICKGSVDPFSEKTIRSAGASQFYMDIWQFDDLSQASEWAVGYGYNKVYRTVPDGGKNIYSTAAGNMFSESLIVIGSEAQGAEELPGSIPVSIPMPGAAESLNVAQAATIVIFEYVRRNFSRAKETL